MTDQGDGGADSGAAPAGKAAFDVDQNGCSGYGTAQNTVDVSDG